MHRIALCFAAALALSGCAPSRPSDTASLSLSLDHLAQFAPDKIVTGSIHHPQAFASMPPQAGAIKRVSQKISVDGVRQEIVLGDPVPGLGESGIELRLRTSQIPTLEEPLAMAKPTEASIRAELTAHFPRMPMQVVERPRSNSYGAYGLAVGRWANGARCIYAWQWIDDLTSETSRDSPKPAAVRVRLCQIGVTLDQMAGYVDHLQLHPASQVNADLMISETDRRPVIDQPPVTPPAKRAPRRVVAKPVQTAAKVRTAPPPAQIVAAIPQTHTPPQTHQLDPSIPAAAYRGPTAIPAGR